jgi:hypothetical protein
MTEQIQKHIRKETGINIVINVLLNGALAWWLLHDKGPLPVWGEHGFGPDLLITGFLLSGIIAAIMIAMHRRKLNKGDLPALVLADNHWLNRMPRNLWLSALAFGLAGALLAAPLLLAVLYLFGFTTLTPLSYALIKGVWAGALAAAVVGGAIRLGLQPAPTT